MGNKSQPQSRLGDRNKDGLFEGYLTTRFSCMNKTQYYCVVKEGDPKLYYIRSRDMKDGDEPFEYEEVPNPPAGAPRTKSEALRLNQSWNQLDLENLEIVADKKNNKFQIKGDGFCGHELANSKRSKDTCSEIFICRNKQQRDWWVQKLTDLKASSRQMSVEEEVIDTRNKLIDIENVDTEMAFTDPEEQEMVRRYIRERKLIQEKIIELQKEVKKGSVQPDFEAKLQELLELTANPERLAYDYQMESVLEQGQNKDALFSSVREASNSMAMSEVHVGSDVFYTPHLELSNELFMSVSSKVHKMSMMWDQPPLTDEQKSIEKRKNELIEQAKNFKPIDRSDAYRPEDCAKNGGFDLNHPETIAKYRGAAKDLVKQVGRQLLSGKFELYKVSFPIKCMSSTTIIQIVASITLHAPIYLMAAAQTSDPIEKMKHVMVTSLSFIYPTHTWDKPLNPILGETCQASMEDGTQIYMEQVSHHPPISYLLLEGPDKLYKWYGYSSFSPKAHFNHIDLCVVGQKTVEFADGTSITFTPQQDKFSNTLFGTLNHLLWGKCEFKDNKSGLTAWYELGAAKKGEPKDNVRGEIIRNGQVVSRLQGNYMGYFDFDGQRYWDVRDMQNFDIIPVPKDKLHNPSNPQSLPVLLKSDSLFRKDARQLDAGDVVKAQEEKNEMEQLQRNDRKLREAAQKRRDKGGAKIDYSVYNKQK